MAISRIHLGVHYPSDIAVGATLGTFVGKAVRRALRSGPGA
jgi:membrane-associated phospholipid phosphatase